MQHKKKISTDENAREPEPRPLRSQTRLVKLLLVFTFALVPGLLRADWLPFTLEHGHIVIDIELAGQPAQAILDSGAEHNAINRRFVEKHGEGMRRSGEMRMQGIHAIERAPLYSNIPLTLYGTTFTLDKVPAVFLGRAELLIGRGFFRAFIIQID